MSVSDLARRHEPKGSVRLRFRRHAELPRRTEPYGSAPGYYPEGALWLYGNVKLLHGRIACVSAFFGPPDHLRSELDEIERQAEALILDAQILVCGIHNLAHQRAAVVALRWGAPRIVVFSGGFFHHLGKNLKEEAFRSARLWRYEWDAATDLAISRRAPDRLPTYASHNKTVDRLIEMIADHTWPGLNSPLDPLTPCQLA